MNIFEWNNKIGNRYSFVDTAPKIRCLTGQPSDSSDAAANRLSVGLVLPLINLLVGSGLVLGISLWVLSCAVHPFYSLYCDHNSHHNISWSRASAETSRSRVSTDKHD